MKTSIRGYCVVFDDEAEPVPKVTYIPFNQIEAFDSEGMLVTIRTAYHNFKLGFGNGRQIDDFCNRLSKQMYYCSMGNP